MDNTVETGDIFFLYTPRPSAAKGPSDVHELAVILSPDDGRRPRRLLVVRDRHLPAPSAPGVAGGQEAIAEVIDVRKEGEKLVEVLEGRVEHGGGSRVVPLPARPCGEGRYVVAVHDNHTHLSYSLELPEIPGQVQRDLGLAKDASYRVVVCVPTEMFQRGRKIKAGECMPVTDVGLLNVEGSELHLQPGMEPDAPMATREKEGPATAEIFGELKIRRATHPTEPLYEGTWM